MGKKIVFLLIVFVFIIIFFVVTGGKRADVMLQDFSVSEDGTKLQLNTTLASSMGYTRKMKVKQSEDNLYLTFYSTFGFNNAMGAKNEFEVTLNSSCQEIYFDKGNGEYKLVLQKNAETNDWKMVN